MKRESMREDFWAAPDLVPAITCHDVPRAAAWLERVLGLRERAEARLTWDGGSIAWFDAGDSLFSISTPDPTWPPSDRPVGPCTMKIYVADLDFHYARAVAEGATIVAGPEDGFWGGRTYRLLDPEGNRWEIAQKGRDLRPDRWQLPPGVARGQA